MRVRVWCEGTAPRSVYPGDVDGAIGDHLRRQKGLEVAASRLGEADAGLSDRVLDATDVLIWWGRLRHADVPEARASAVADRVRAGRLGFVALHASCGSKPFRELMGCPCEPGGWREDGRPERVTIQKPDHPIARGVAPFTIPKVAMYEEPFDVPEPDDVVFLSRYDGDKSFRSGLTWTIDRGRVAYFRPGHDAFPVLFHPSVRRVIANAAPMGRARAGLEESGAESAGPSGSRFLPLSPLRGEGPGVRGRRHRSTDPRSEPIDRPPGPSPGPLPEAGRGRKRDRNRESAVEPANLSAA